MTGAVVKLFDLENDGLNMAEDGEFLYIRCKREIIKYSFADMSQAARSVVFKKDGKARSLSVCGGFALLTDFCTLHVLTKIDLQEIYALRLGTDLSSDIWAARLDSKVYAAVRNGKMAAVDIETRNVRYYDITDSSFWDYLIIGNRIYAGTVRGELLEIDKDTMGVLRRTELCRNKNIYSLAHNNKMLYTVSQDKTIKALDIASFEVANTAKKAVGNMAQILGIYNDGLIVADSNKVSVWDIHTLQHRDIFAFPTGHFNKGALLAGGRLFGSDFNSVYSADLG
jgi:outer membrane protein assembly factor BamB